MASSSCRAALLGIVLASVALAPADARQFRSSDVQPLDAPTVQAVAHMSVLLRQRTGGRYGIDVEHGDRDSENFTIAQVRTGVRDMARVNLAVFNSLFRDGASRATLEWRFVRRNGQVIPYATIQRYFTKHDGGAGEVLVVTKVTASEDCHVAHIDALHNADAIALARTIADQEARNFDCKSGPRKVGRSRKSL